MSKTIGRIHSDGVYVGRKACGCAVAVVTDTSDKLTAKSVAEFIKEGLKVMWVHIVEGLSSNGPVTGALLQGQQAKMGM